MSKNEQNLKLYKIRYTPILNISGSYNDLRQQEKSDFQSETVISALSVESAITRFHEGNNGEIDAVIYIGEIDR